MCLYATLYSQGSSDNLSTYYRHLCKQIPLEVYVDLSSTLAEEHR